MQAGDRIVARGSRTTGRGDTAAACGNAAGLWRVTLGCLTLLEVLASSFGCVGDAPQVAASDGGHDAASAPDSALPDATAAADALGDDAAVAEDCYTEEVPYFYQYDNSYNPSGSCQNTSVAMTLAYYGWTGTPDTISATWGTAHAQSPAGLAEVFNSYAEDLGIPQRMTPHLDGTFEGLKSLLCRERPVVIHGYFTASGHVVVATGYDEAAREFAVNDPAGQWNGVFMGSYSGDANSGHDVRYGEDEFYAAVATSDGSTFLELWYHEITP